MEVLATSVEGLTLIIDDCKATYTMNGNELLMDGEYACGEAWINNEWFSYERVDGKVIFEDADGVERYTFEDSEEGFDNFAASVL
jgi:hypothetical protein